MKSCVIFLANYVNCKALLFKLCMCKTCWKRTATQGSRVAQDIATIVKCQFLMYPNTRDTCNQRNYLRRCAQALVRKQRFN